MSGEIEAELGMLGGVLTPIGLRTPLGHADFDPVYRTAERLGCALAVHAGPSQGLGLDVLDRFAQVHALAHPYAQMIQMTSIIMGGVLDRFPTLHLAFLEAGASWVPFLSHRMDRSYEGRKHPEYVGGVLRRPSTYVSGGNVYFSAEPGEDSLPHVTDVIGTCGKLDTHDAAPTILHSSSACGEPSVVVARRLAALISNYHFRATETDIGADKWRELWSTRSRSITWLPIRVRYRVGWVHLNE
jgi:hypothetical protein